MIESHKSSVKGLVVGTPDLSAGSQPALRLAIIGARGLPADLPKAGGGEREVEAKAVRLAQRGHDVTVYCRWHYNRSPISPWRGVKLISLPSVNTKNLDTVTHTLLSILHAAARNTADIVCFHGMGNALFVPLSKLAGKKTIVYMDGIDWERPKWGPLARLALWAAARIACKWSDGVYVDNHSSQAAFARLFGETPEVITLAAEVSDYPGCDALHKFGLQPNQYILFVGLLKPDKGVHLLVEAYEGMATNLPLVIIGDSPDPGPYVHQLKSTQDKRIHFLGYVYGSDAQQLYANAAIYVQPSLMEGNSPSLMTAMSYARPVVVSDIPQNLETAGEGAAPFRCGDALSLRRVLVELLDSPQRMISLGKMARRRIDTCYNWDVVVDQLEQFCYRVSGQGPAIKE